MKLPILPHKPPFGDPCNGCGDCCIGEQCGIGKLWIPAPDDSVCEALMHNGERFACGLVHDPELFGLDQYASDAISDALGIGCGCDSECAP